MPLNIIDFPANPECGGTQWSVTNEDQLATLVAMVLIGRTRMAVRVLEGTQVQVAITPVALKERLRTQLQTLKGPLTFHRDGLLFEIITWLVANMTAGEDEVISEPHLSSTRQGLDTIKISFDRATRNVIRAVIYEQKCTDNARNKFVTEVLPAFRKWLLGARDNELLQATVGLLQGFDLTDAERIAIYDRLLQDRPLAFQAALTVTPHPFQTTRCVDLYAGYAALTPLIQNRLGDTFPLPEIRTWFEGFAQSVWAKIQAGNV